VDSSVSKFWFRYSPYWPLFLTLIAFGLFDAWIFLKIKNPQYEASTSLLIKDQKKGIDESKIVESLNNLSSKTISENEVEILKSKSLINEVVDSLHLYAPVAYETTFRDVPLYKESPVFIEVRQKEKIQAVDKIYFSFNSLDKSVIINNKKYPTDEWVGTPYGMLNFHLNNSQANAIPGQLFFSLINPQRVADRLVKDIAVSTSGKLSSVITLTIRDASGKRAEDILNSLTHFYIENSLMQKRALAKDALSFIEERLRSVSGDLDSIDFNLESYKTSKEASDIGSQNKVYLETMSQTNEKLSDINIQLEIADQIEKYVKRKEGGAGIVPSAYAVKDQILISLLDKLYALELEYESKKKTTGANSQILLAIADQINKIKPSILENIQNLKASLTASKRNLEENSRNYQSSLKSLPKKERDILQIGRNRNIKSDIHDFLLQKREETALSSISVEADSQIIDFAKAGGEPVSPNAKIVFGIAILTSILAGMGLVAGSSIFRNKVMFRSEIESRTKVPVISEINAGKKGVDIVMEFGKRTVISEQFRRLRASVFSKMDNTDKVLLMTSSISGEGKSFVAANLGFAAAISGKKTVLVELDLINPTLSKKINFTETATGVTEVLKGTEILSNVIFPSGLDNNLFIIPSGSLPYNPSELIAGGALGSVIEELKRKFDLVIIDSAPVRLLSDAAMISQYCDGILFIVRHNYTPKNALKRLDEELKELGMSNVRIVFNGIKPRGFGVNRYGYGYGYGYGYVEEDNSMKKNRKKDKAPSV